MGVSVDYLRECFRIEGGKLFWLVRPLEHFPDSRAQKIWNTKFAGKEAGYANIRRKGDPRWLVAATGSMYLRYQIIWAMVHGEWTKALDHKNCDSLDDRVENLRPASQSQNMANTRRKAANTSGYKGVKLEKRTGKWVAQIRINYHRIHLGTFADPAEAHQVYMVAAKQAWGEFARSS